MKLFQYSLMFIFICLSADQLNAGKDGKLEEESSYNLPIKSNNTEYHQALELLSRKFGRDIAEKLLPQRFDVGQKTDEEWLESNSLSVLKMARALDFFELDWVNFGLCTLVPNCSLQGVFNHFLSVFHFFSYATELSHHFSASQKIHFHPLKNLYDLINITSEFDTFDPKSTVALWDLHGTLTRVGTPRYGETNIEARNLAPQLIKDMANAGIKNIVVSAWDNMDEVVAQIKHLGLSEVFEIPDTYQTEKASKNINGSEAIFTRVGNVISVKLNPLDCYYKDKIYALDVMALSPKTIILVDDSRDNLSKAAVHFGATNASKSASSFHVFSLDAFQDDEPAELSETDLQKWKTTLKLTE